MRFAACSTWTVFLVVLVFGGRTASILAQGADSSAGTVAAAVPSVQPAPDSATGQENPSAPTPQTGYITGVVIDENGSEVPSATVVAEDGTPADRRAVAANENGVFQFSGLTAGNTYHVTITAKGFEKWTSPEITFKPGEFFTVTGIQLKVEQSAQSVTVYASTAQIATEQVQVEEKQRVLGFIPNFYVVYDSKNVVPMTAKLKFQLAFKAATDPVSIAGALFLAGINQAEDTPNYQEGWKGYGQRAGAAYADGFTDIMFGGAILPVLLHQDPRYYYQGTGSHKSRLMHALEYPFICKADDGHLEPNYSTMGGDLISASLSNLYYPTSNRGAGLVFSNFGINTAERMLSTVLQEFVLRKLTPSAKNQN